MPPAPLPPPEPVRPPPPSEPPAAPCAPPLVWMQTESRRAQLPPPRHTPQSQSLSVVQPLVAQYGPMLELRTQRWLTEQESPLHEVITQPWLSAPGPPVWHTVLPGQV